MLCFNIEELRIAYEDSATDEPSDTLVSLIARISKIERRGTVVVLELCDRTGLIQAWIQREVTLTGHVQANHLRSGAFVGIRGHVFRMCDLHILVEDLLVDIV